MISLPVPSIHLNGTSKESLTDALREAYQAIGDAYMVHRETAPNARDYYPQGPQAFQKAREAFEARCRKLVEVREELLAIFEGIDS